MRDHIRPHIHEAKTFLHFKKNGLSPYWALRNLLIKELDGHGDITTEIDGVPYHIDLAYSDSGIAPRPGDSIQRDVLRDWELHVDGPNEAKAHFQIRARYDDMRGPDGDLKKLAWPGGDGLDVLCQSSNIPFDQLIPLLRGAIDSLADSVDEEINRTYFRQPAPTSKIVTVEWYVRIRRQYARKLVRSDGVFHKIMHLLSPEKGMEWVYKGDNSEIVGHRHAMDLPPAAISKLGPDYSLGVRAKSYHPKHARKKESDDDPLSSPKLGVAFHKSIDGEARSWDERDELRREIEEILINLMEWAGIPTEPDPTTFVDDDHFSVEPSEVSIGRLSDPTPDLEANQESLLMTVLGEISPAAQDVTETIATDGGTHYTEIADETDNSVSTIYRALEQLGELVESERGIVRFTSEKIRQEIIGMVDRLDELKESTADRVAELANIELRSSADSAVEKWMAKYGAELVDFDGDGGTLRFDTLLTRLKSVDEPNLWQTLQEGMDAWESTGRNWQKFARLRVDADLRSGAKFTRRVGDLIVE